MFVLLVLVLKLFGASNVVIVLTFVVLVVLVGLVWMVLCCWYGFFVLFYWEHVVVWSVRLVVWLE